MEFFLSNGRLLKSSDGFEYLYDHTGVLGFKYQGATYLYRKDIQGNIIAVLNEYGTVQFTYEYDAWGNFTAYDKNGNVLSTSGRTSPTGSEPTKLCDKNPFKYRGYFYDWQTGLYYLQTRYYDPSTGRFISVDSFEYANPETIDGLNLYVYCGNNPVMYIDPTGHSILAIFGTLLLGALISGVINGIVDVATGGNFFGAFAGGLVLGLISTFGLSVAIVANPIIGLALVAFSSYIAGFSGSVIQQGIDKGWNKIDYKSAAKSGAITMGLSIVMYGISSFVVRNTVGLFENVLDKTLKASTRIANAMSISLENFMLTICYFSWFNLIDSLVNKLI